MKLTAKIHPQTVTAHVNAPTLSTGFDKVVVRKAVERDPYTGGYEITPTTEEQILVTRGMRMTDDIVVKRIPQNYGQITWSGLGIRVS